ncbi:hypothetical protein BH09PLA1_BH09PLA1_07170 [soil metagenome]
MLSTTFTALMVALLAQLSLKTRPAPPPPEPAIRFSVATENIPQAQIDGVVLPAAGDPRGTVFLCHGFSRRKEDLYGWDWIRRELGWNLVAFDFREHGESTRTLHLTTLGYHEIWDVKAVVDHAEKTGLAKPYVIYGSSMGASVGLRWAARDPRISGVIAVSPYRNALGAAQMFFHERLHLNLAPQGAWTEMLRAVDLPRDLRQRNDLRIWILCGQFDIFREPDQRAILAGSKSPANLKKLFVIPGGRHSNLWRWQGNDRVPSHDRIVREFLAECH